MGLFDKVIKKAVNDVAGGAVGDRLGGALGDALGKVEQATGIDFNQDGVQGSSRDVFGAPQQATNTQNYQRYDQQPAAVSPGMERKDHAYFLGVLRDVFPQYQIAEYVDVSQFGGEGKPYDFVLIDNGRAAATIMLTEHNKSNNRAFKGAKAASEAAGVPFINFFLHMPNERGFIINRVKRFLGQI